jgi:hypothetical protein
MPHSSPAYQKHLMQLRRVEKQDLFEAWLNFHNSSDRDFYECFRHVWIHSEGASINKSLWLTMMESSRPGKDKWLMTKEEISLLKSFPDKVQVYRGCSTNKVNGLSWTILGTARSLLQKSAGLRSPARASLAVAQFPWARRRAFLRAELQSDWIVVSRRAAQLIHSDSRKRETQAGVAVHGRGASRWPAQLGFAMRGWSVPPWGLLPQDAGQCAGRGLRLHRVPLKLRSCVRLAEGGCKGRAGSPANA